MEKGWKSVDHFSQLIINPVLYDWVHLFWCELTYFALGCTRRGYTHQGQ